MLDGCRFVEAVAHLGYPGASTLKGEDFDWLFDTPEHQQFLRFFCSGLTRSNVLSPEEARSFRALRDAGKPILDEASLGKVLKTCQTASATDVRALPAGLDEVNVAQLEQELQALRRERNLKVRRHRKLQVLLTARTDAAMRLSLRRDEASRQLKDAVASLGAENAEMNAGLQMLTEEVKRLATFLRVAPCRSEQDLSEPPCTLPPGHAVFLSQLSLRPYLCQEEANTKALALLTQKQFFQGISDIVESSTADNFQLLELSTCEEEDEQVVEARRTEMARLQWAHIVAQHELFLARAEERAACAGLQCIAENMRSKAKQCRVELEPELRGLVAELQALLCKRVPSALRESAQLLNVSVVRGDFNLQVARQDYYTSRQDQVCSYLLRQKASFELLQLAHELELRKERHLQRQLGDAVGHLNNARTILNQRLHTFSQPKVALIPRPCDIIGPSDSALSRLYRVLESVGGLEQEQPYQTYEGLMQAAQSLQDLLRSTLEALAAASQEEAFSSACLEGECSVLRGATHCGLQQPVLAPQICATLGQELCPSSQELRGGLQGLEAQLDCFNKMMKEILMDIRGKRAQLERSPTLRCEREFYVYFHLDVKLLRKMVEDLEARVGSLESRP
ncbi:HAUS augmin-like complex subunit 3 [Scleropages formosus]|uniref:HAUS augmin-like complex subunit 3 n=1 Tax=Scleropages formosus TaxID=113540 RepID=UPI0010FA841C|nr:HAUS augmin-like complex subunit 3 [Scleropages formosus]XP_018585446.2 HAUS augmin-like complex subunit 3 [Scleropages formosus]